MNDTPLWRNGKVVLKTRALPDGSTLMFKPFIIKTEHIMRLTDAPGWDKEHVDAVFTDGIAGLLRYQQDIVQYDIPIDVFREHAFVKDMGAFGEQYHVHRKYYKSTGLRTVDPKRFLSGIPAERDKEAPVIPKQIVFGEWSVCTKCKGTGGAKKERCPKCQGTGLVKLDAGSGSVTS